MDTTNMLNKFSPQITELNAALTSKKQSAAEWLSAVESDADESHIATLAEQMNSDHLHYARLKLALEIESERAIGRGGKLGNFWDAVYEMQQAQ